MGQFDRPKAKRTVRAIRSFKDPSLTTGIFILDTLDVLRSGIVDPALVIRVQVNGDYEERGQNGGSADLLFWPGMLTY